MKNKRIWLALLLVFTLVLGACGQKPEEPATTEPATEEAGAETTEEQEDTEKPEETEAAGAVAGELTVQAEEAWVPYYEAAIARVKEANPDANIRIIEMGAFDHLDTIDKTDPTNPDVADLFALPADRVYGLVNNEILGAVDSKAIAEKVGGWDDFDAGIGGNFNIDGEYFAFPYNIETLILFINKANAEAAGVDTTQPMEATEMGADQLLLPLFDAWYGVAVTNSSDIDLLGKDGDAFVSDMTLPFEELPAEKQATMKGIFDYWKANYDAGSSLFDTDAGWGYIDTTFTSGNAGIVRLGGPWETNAISGFANEGADMEVQPIGNLTFAGKPLRHWQSGWGLGINVRIEEDADKVALAEALIAEIVNPEYAVDLFKATGKILENVGPEVYTGSDLSDSDKAVIESVILSYQDAPARPLFLEWGSVWDTWKNAVLSWNSVTPADEAAAYNEIKASFDAMMLNVQ